MLLPLVIPLPATGYDDYDNADGEEDHHQNDGRGGNKYSQRERSAKDFHLSFPLGRLVGGAKFKAEIPRSMESSRGEVKENDPAEPALRRKAPG